MRRALDHSERLMREAIRAIPDGVYRASAFLDNDGIALDQPIECPITVRVEGARFIVDSSEISPQVRGPFNSGRDGGGITCARIAFKYLTTPEESTNEGSFAPLEVILPDGKFLSASATAPMARVRGMRRCRRVCPTSPVPTRWPAMPAAPPMPA